MDGNVTMDELYVLCGLVSELQPSSIFEFGTFDGRSTLNMALNAPEHCRIYTLDLDPSAPATRFDLSGYEKTYTTQPKGKRFEDHELATRITQLSGDSADFDFTAYHNRVDLVFIDASHAYEYVKHDTETAFRLLRHGKGVIVWHDCGVWDGVTSYLNERYVSDPGFNELKLVQGTSLAVLKVG
jgi:predicted O-methyltransferase YrrM